MTAVLQTGGLWHAATRGQHHATDGAQLGRESDEAADLGTKFQKVSAHRRSDERGLSTHGSHGAPLGVSSPPSGFVRPACAEFFFPKRKDIPMKTRETICELCGAQFADGHWDGRRLLCAECHSGSTPPVAMPCTPAQRRQLDLWLAPLVPSKAQTPRHAQAVQAQGPCGHER